jgi:hypothetical protein
VRVDPGRRRRVRLAVYGPATTGLLGLALLVGGVFGITRAQLVDPVRGGPGQPPAGFDAVPPR